ncbi:glutamate [NMDA] receptor subunit 1-like [Panulirus ornatus]|uniref:glutamate [NMDA] receptor subunit 1-like n=1 Tax=Panulirus ornatus TaxID=150431 RepID=UPI003A8B7090
MGIQQLLQESSPSSPVQWGDDDTVFPEADDQAFMGHTFKVVTNSYFPFIDCEPGGSDGSLVPRDSLDTRLLNTVSAHLNFTYDMREPWDGTWGVPLTGGNWSGIVGTLQYEQADFSVNLTPSPARMKVISHSKIYSYDPLLIVSLKPGPLPRHSALLRPFEDGVWEMVIAFTSAAGVILWLLQKVWSWASGHPSISLVPALLYIWGLLLQEPLPYPSVSVSAQVKMSSYFVRRLVYTCRCIIS